jgi:hypothetical protein
MASVVMRETNKADEKGNIDEIKQYRDAQWVTPLEALWRIYGFDLSKNHAPVQQLQLHLPDMHMVAFHKRDKVERIVNRPGVEESMLTAYFNANRHHEEDRGILPGRLMVNFGRKGKTPFSKLELSSRLILLRENATFFVFS